METVIGMVLRRHLLLLAVLLSLVLRSAYAESPSPSEYEVKAAFLYNLAKFIEWPRGALPEEEATFNIGVAGDSPMFKAISSIGEKTIKDHKLSIIHLTAGTPLDSLQIIFIDRTVSATDQLLNRLKGSKTLTVGETDDFNKRGGIVNFVILNNHIGFEINQKYAEQMGFSISSKLLNLARITPP